MQNPESDSELDVVVIGAGLSGIVAAQRQLQAQPSLRLKILEQDGYVGGVWNERRTYPSFWTHWTYGVAEFSDMSMERPPAEDSMYDMFKAKYTTKYLEDYVENMRTGGLSLRDRIQFNTRVLAVTKVDHRWRICCLSTDGNSDEYDLYTKRLLVANGQASSPNMPDLPGKEDFQGIVLHSVDFGQSDVISNEKISHVTVVGAGKSSADMVYEAAKAGKQVSWVIRPTGPESTGPAYFVPADIPTPYENAGLSAQTRVMASLQPTFLNKTTWWAWFLHNTNLGVKLVKWLFSKVDAQVRNRAAYRERKSTKGFEKLEYETELFWQNGAGGVLHFNDFWPLVAEKVSVYRGSVKKLTKNELYLDDPDVTHFPCDAVLCGTGWTNGLDIFNTEQLMRLGLPYPKALEQPEREAKWEKLVSEKDAEVLNRFLILQSPPKHPHPVQNVTPYRLYKGMAPLEDDSILFINHVVAANKFFAAEAQAMWAAAYFDRSMKLPSVEEREQEVATWIAWCRRRYLSNGELGNCVVFDGVPYVDSLLDNLGVTAHRNKGSLRNFFAPIRPADLGKAWNEYLEARPT